MADSQIVSTWSQLDCIESLRAVALERAVALRDNRLQLGLSSSLAGNRSLRIGAVAP